jgi:quinol monooxygenase YgiN
MYLIRELFNAKPGKAKELVKKFKQAIPHFEKTEGGKNYRIMTDAVSTYWTVVMEYEVEDMGAYFSDLRGSTATAELQEIMKGYTDLVEGGKREVFLLE